MRQKKSVGEYLAFLAVKYEVSPEDFLYALRLAEEKEESRCGNLSIQCRGKIRDSFIFLIKSESEVVAQFPISAEFLFNESNHLRSFIDTDKIRRYLAKKASSQIPNSIRDLRTGMRHVNLKAKILDVAAPTHIVTRYGNHASFVNASIVDETGTIKLCLWNGQIGSVSVGDTVQIENARVSAFKGERYMSLEKKGTLNVEISAPCL